MGLVRLLQPWDFLLIDYNNQLKKYITPLLRLVRGQSLFSFWCLCQKLSLSLFILFFLPFHHILFSFKKNFNWRLITLQYCSGFCHTMAWISPGCTCVPHPETPFHLPPHPIPLSHPSAPALSILYHASNLDWQFISHMIIYMFQCYSVKSSHLCLLPESKSLFFTSVSLLLSRI